MSLVLAAAPAQAVPAPAAKASPDAAVADSLSAAGTPAVAPAQVMAGPGGAGISGSPGRGIGTDADLPGAGALPDSPVVLGNDVGIQDVIGTDDRTRVNPTTTFPARAIVQIIRTTNGTTWGCTGWLYGPSIVATAGHCVHPGNGQDGGGGNGFYPRGDFQIVPGRNGATRPYGTCTATQLLSVVGWTQNGNEGYDYGAIRLNCTVGNTTGWFGLWWQSASLTGLSTTISGYPCDRTFGEQWQHAGQTVTVTQDLNIFYQNDTAGCQSGSPVYQTRGSGSSFCTGQCVMGIHAYGRHGSSPHSTNTHGTRITESVFNNLIAWRDS